MRDDSDGYFDAELERALELYINLLDGHINRGIFVLDPERKKKNDKIKYDCARLMLLSAGVSLLSFKKFYGPITLQTKDVVILFRAVFEGIVNALYVLSSNPEVAKKAFRHSLQKDFRLYRRAANLVRSKTPSQFPIPAEKLQEILTEFTSVKGRERNWTDDTVKKRIDVIAETFGNKPKEILNTVYDTLYGVSSEYIHSSLYWGAQLAKNKSRKDLIQDLIEGLNISLTCCGTTVIAMLDVLEIETGIGAFKKAAADLQEVTIAFCENVGQVRE